MKKQYGFTLIELMATTAIFAIIVSVAVPSFRDMFEKQNIPGVARQFENSIKLARTEAINRNTTIDIRPTSGTTDWSQGWYLEYTDADDNTELIREFEAIEGSPTFTSTVFDDDTRLQILSNGQAETIGNFNLVYPNNCNAGSFTFQLLNSGLLRKVADICP
ncbi:MAG: GspH/FimT family pseudopilin [Bermanella sp.]